MKTFKISFTLIATVSMICLIAFGNQTVNAKTLKTLNSEMAINCPSASFTIVNNGIVASTPIQFINQSSGASAYLWDFGDGTFSTELNPNHIYGTAGTYTVTLKAIVDGCVVEFIGTEDVMVF